MSGDDLRQVAAILAALRLWQQVHSDCAGDLPEEFEDIATNGGQFDRLDMDEIDELCERINSTGCAAVIVMRTGDGSADRLLTEYSP